MIKENSQEKRGETAGKGIIHGISAIYLFMVACMVPLYMYDGYYGLSSGKFILYRNIGFLFLPILLFLIIGKGIRGSSRRKGWENRVSEGINSYCFRKFVCFCMVYAIFCPFCFLPIKEKECSEQGAGIWDFFPSSVF